MPEVVYEIPDDFKAVFVVIYCFGWMFLGIVSILQANCLHYAFPNAEFNLKSMKVSASFAVDHFELFGLRQGLKMGNMLKILGQGKMVTRFHYYFVRHPLMTGLLLMFWFTPIMTMGKFIYDTAGNSQCKLQISVVNMAFHDKLDKVTLFSR